MKIKPANELLELVTKILLAAGADERNASVVAEHLVRANLSGVDTHGVWHLASYVEAIKEGLIIPTACPAIVTETPNSALVTGNWTFGQAAAQFAMETAIEKSKSQNVAVVALVQSHHVGRLGHYTERAAAEGMISMVWGGGYGEKAPAAMPYGGCRRLLHTNPISMGFPAGDEPAMIFDFATTAVSGVKVVNAKNQNQELPPGCIVDRDGYASRNPNDFFQGGGYIPFGGHKGYALMMAAEFLGRIFSGSDEFFDLKRGGPIMQHQGVALIVFKADLFQPLADYTRRADEMEQRTRKVPPAPGFKEVLVPGDPENQARNRRQREGIPIDEDTWQSLVELAASTGIQLS